MSSFPSGCLVSDIYTEASLPGTKDALLFCKAESVSKGGHEGLLLLAPEALSHCDPKIFVTEKEKAFSSLSPTSILQMVLGPNVVNSNRKSELLLVQRCPEGVGSVDEICKGCYGEVCL